MKSIKLFIPLFFALLMLSACAHAPVKLTAKYDNLDQQLKQVSGIYRFNLTSWEDVDNQSLIVQTSPNSYYLIVLQRPAYQLPFTETVAISNTADFVRSGYDKVTVFSPSGKESYIIYKIFKLEGRQAATRIREQLSPKRRGKR